MSNDYETVEDYTDLVRPGVLTERTARPGAHRLWLESHDKCVGEEEVDNTDGTAPIFDGTLLIDEDEDFVGIMYGHPVMPGTKDVRSTTRTGSAIVWEAKLIFPAKVVTNAPDGPDAGPDTVAENAAASAAATAALETKLRGQMAARGIEIQK